MTDTQITFALRLAQMRVRFGTPAAIAVRPPDLASASAYADRFAVELLCFSAREAACDLDGGNARLAEVLNTDKRFRGWLCHNVYRNRIYRR